MKQMEELGWHGNQPLHDLVDLMIGIDNFSRKYDMMIILISKKGK
ncbi:MAG TPA: hypothetical protein VFD57_03875 [Clostridia bacterium]|nr:hypothetical protein [Clostridia bacterium]